MDKNIVIVGAGGMAKVVADIIIKNNDNIIGFLDDNLQEINFLGYKIIGKVKDIEKFKDPNTYFIIAIGDNKIRKQIFEKYDLNYYTAIHNTAVIGSDVKIGKGTMIMASAVINSSSHIGNACIINTGSIVEHDNRLADYVHISPNATLSGTVSVGECTHIGTAVSVKNNIDITKNCIIGVGAVVVKDITQTGVYVGLPARKSRDI